MDIVWRDLVRQIFEMITLKHLCFVKTSLIIMPFWVFLAIEEVKKFVNETALVVVLNV